MPLTGAPTPPRTPSCPVPIPAGTAQCPLPRPIFTPSLHSSGLVHIKNPYLDSMEEDVLYHLDLGTKTHNLPAMFGDIKVNSRCKSKAAAPSPAGLSSPSFHSSAVSCRGPATADAPTGDGARLLGKQTQRPRAAQAGRSSVLACFG